MQMPLAVGNCSHRADTFQLHALHYYSPLLTGRSTRKASACSFRCMFIRTLLLSTLISSHWSPVPAMAIKHPETTDGRHTHAQIATLTLFSSTRHHYLRRVEEKKRLHLISDRVVIIARQKRKNSQFNCRKMYFLLLVALLLLMADGAQE